MGFSAQIYHPKPSLTFPLHWQYWLDIAKPTNVTLTLPKSCYEIFKFK